MSATPAYFQRVDEDNPLPTRDSFLQCLMRRVLDALLSPVGYDSSSNRMRQTAVLESGTVTTVITVTGVTNIDGRNGAMAIQALDDTAWYMAVRSRIS